MTVTRQNNKLFGEVLRAYRLEKQLTQEQLSERVDVIRPFISALENGTRQPSLAMILRLAKALDITPGKLLDPVAEKMEPKYLSFQILLLFSGLLLLQRFFQPHNFISFHMQTFSPFFLRITDGHMPGGVIVARKE